MYHNRKVTVRFTCAEYALLELAAARLPIRFNKATVSKFIRQAVRDKIAGMGITEADLKASNPAAVGKARGY